MRLHFLLDEKIVNRAISVFEETFPGDNKFIILLKKSVSFPKFVKEQENVFFTHYNIYDFWEIIGDVQSYSHVVIHFLSTDVVKFLNKIEHPSIFWIAWGADLYSGLLEKRGYKLYEKKDILWNVSRKKLPYFMYRAITKWREKQNWRARMAAVKKIRYFVPDSMYDEYPLLLSYYPEFSHLEYRNFFYYPINEILGDILLHKQCNGNSIIVGNSSAMTGNHFSVFSRLSALPLDDRKVVVPLSYGNTRYRDLVVEDGMNKLKENFKPVLDFLPLDQYNELLLSGNIFIYGNWRQEAVGNILIALYLGGKVFLDAKNPLLKFYRSLGILLFDLEELSALHLNKRLSQEEILQNQNILANLYSREKLLSMVKQNFY